MDESGENYLETILRLKEKNGMVRSIDIAHQLNFSKPSVSRAIGILKEDGYITVSYTHLLKRHVLFYGTVSDYLNSDGEHLYAGGAGKWKP